MSPIRDRAVRRRRGLAPLVPLVRGVQTASTPLRPAPKGSIGEPRRQEQVPYSTVPLAYFRQAQTRARGPVPPVSPPAGPREPSAVTGRHGPVRYPYGTPSVLPRRRRSLQPRRTGNERHGGGMQLGRRGGAGRQATREPGPHPAAGLARPGVPGGLRRPPRRARHAGPSREGQAAGPRAGREVPGARERSVRRGGRDARRRRSALTAMRESRGRWRFTRPTVVTPVWTECHGFGDAFASGARRSRRGGRRARREVLD